MVSADSTLWGSRKTMSRLQFEDEPAPVSVQIMGADPQRMAEAAKRCVERGANIIDINMGCPARKVCKVESGAALMRDEGLAGRILEAVVRAVDLPVTLKMRTGWSPEERNAPTIARIAEEAGIAALAIHGRTRACVYSGQAEFETLKEIVAQRRIPVIANGDIDSPQRAAQVLQETGAAGLMIGRAAQGRPWIFTEIAHFLTHATHLPEKRPGEIAGVLQQHLAELYAFYGERHGVRLARKHIAWYSRGMAVSANFRAAINQAASAGEQARIIQDFFAEQEELAA
jgi:tRNA-dihydrouridine synthase B